MKKIINNILFRIFIIILFLFLSPSINKANAVTITFCSNNGSSIWQVTGSYIGSGVNVPYSQSFSGLANSTSNISSLCGTGYNYYYHLSIPGVSQFLQGDQISWSQACVDPTANVSIIPSKYNEPNDTYVINISCYPMGTAPANGETNSTYFYAGCGTNYKNLNTTLLANGICTPPTNSQYCTSNEYTNPTACVAPNYCSGETCLLPAPSTAPTGLSANPFCNSTTSTITFSWNAVSGTVTGYHLWYKYISDTSWNGPYTVSGTSFTVPSGSGGGFTYGKVVDWYVSAYNAGGDGPHSTVAQVTSATCTGSNPAPTNLNASPFCQTFASGVNFSWTTATGANSYQLKYTTTSGTTYGPYAVTGTSDSIPNSSCTTGPGGCSFNYNVALTWTVAACTGSDGLTGCGTAVSGPGVTTNTCRWACNSSNQCVTNTSGTFSSNTCGGTCTAVTVTPAPVTCQQCSSTTCQTYTPSGSCTTNCNACSTTSCMNIKAKIAPNNG